MAVMVCSMDAKKSETKRIVEERVNRFAGLLNIFESIQSSRSVYAAL